MSVASDARQTRLEPAGSLRRPQSLWAAARADLDRESTRPDSLRYALPLELASSAVATSGGCQLSYILSDVNGPAMVPEFKPVLPQCV